MLKKAVRYLALIDDREVEFADARAVIEACRRGELPVDAWLKEADAEADWQTLGEMFPALTGE